MKRHKAWLERECQAKTFSASWRPQQIYRTAARRWACALDNQLRMSTVWPGLSHFRPGDDPCWSDWKTWPSLCIAKDQGSHGEAGFWALAYGLGLNMWS